MNKLDALLEQLDSVPYEGVVRDRGGVKIEYGSICADAKTAIKYLVRHTYNLQQENNRLKQGTKVLVKAINEFERHLNL